MACLLHNSILYMCAATYDKGISHFTKRIQDQSYLTTSFAQRSWMRVRGRGSSNYMRSERSGETGVVYTLCIWKEQSMGMVQRQ